VERPQRIRPFQFRLRSLLLVIALCAMVCAPFAYLATITAEYCCSPPYFCHSGQGSPERNSAVMAKNNETPMQARPTALEITARSEGIGRPV